MKKKKQKTFAPLREFVGPVRDTPLPSRRQPLKDKFMKLTAVIPCYNEEAGLDELHRRVSAVCRTCVGDEYELVLVNDGSRDASWHVMMALAAQDKRIVAVNLSRNFGHQLALAAGLKLARGERIFILDADLQDPPELLPAMMARMDEGCDVVYGVRTARPGETVFKTATAHLFYRLLDKMVDIDIPPDTGDFRLMSRRANDILNNMPEHHRFIRGMVSWIGLKQEALPYERAPRLTGQSHYPLAKMLRLAVDAITGFSIRPLRMAAYAGLCCSFATVLMLIYTLIEHFTGRTVEGWTSLAVIVLAIGSVQMLIIGVIGEYLGRLYMEVKGRPLYVIQDIVASPDLAAPAATP